MTSHRMLVFSNAAEGRDQDFNDWYEGHHIPEIVGSAAGFTAAQRYRCSPDQRSSAIECPWEYLAIYELEIDDVTEAYGALHALRDAGRFTPHGGSLADGHVAWTYTELTPLLRESAAATAAKQQLGTKEHEFVILTNPTEGREADFLHWYDLHLPEVLENYPGLTTGQLFKAAPTQRHGSAPEWQYLALYDLVADDVAEYFAVEPHGLKGMATPDGALGPRPAQWVFTPISARVEKADVAAETLSGAAG